MNSPQAARANARPEGWLRLLQTAAVFLAVSLPFALRVMPLFILLIAIATIALRVRYGHGSWHRPTFTSALPWMAVFYLLHVLGMTWTTNTAFGVFDLEVKAAFIVFPVLWWLLPSGSVLERSKVLRAFVWANAGAVLICLLAATWHFGNEYYLRGQGRLPVDPAWTNHFFESRFSQFLHPSYMAMYLSFALATVLLQPSDQAPPRFLSRLLPALLVLGIILCNSKMGWLTLAVVIGLSVLGGWRDAAMRRRLLVLSGIGVALFTALFMAFPTVSGKLTQAVSATGAIDPTSDQSSALRRMAWDAATDLFKAQPLQGVGTGDIKDELIAVYQAKGYVHAEAKRMNAHSQFLQSAAALGISALLVLMTMVLLPLIKAFRSHHALLVAFWLIIALNWSVESMAEVQAGVIFLAFFAWLVEGCSKAALRSVCSYDPE